MKIEIKMPISINFNDFMTFQADTFRQIFKEIEEVYPSAHQTDFKNLIEMPRSSSSKENKTKEIVEKSIHEVDKTSSKSKSPMKLKLPKKDIKRLNSGQHRNIEKIKRKEKVENLKPTSTMKNGGKVKILSEPIVFAPQFEIID